MSDLSLNPPADTARRWVPVEELVADQKGSIPQKRPTQLSYNWLAALDLAAEAA